MIARKGLSILCLILIRLSCFGQMSGDSIVCISAHQVRVINLAFNDMNRMGKEIVIKDSMIGTKDLKISLLTNLEQARSEQLVLTNVELMRLQKANKKLIFKLWIHKGLIVAGILATVILLH